MRPVYVQLYKARQRLLEEGGSAALAETATDGKDLMSSMSGYLCFSVSASPSLVLPSSGKLGC
jgi:hypothetical protein